MQEKLFPFELLEKQLQERIKSHHAMAEIGSNMSKKKQRAAANALGEFLCYLRNS